MAGTVTIRQKTTLVVAAFFANAVLMLGCRCSPTINEGSSSATGRSAELTAIDRGRVVYNANCISCHHGDPKRVGSLGPEVWGSSKELLEARLLKAAYPDGYIPKRKSTAMSALPHLASDIDALTAFLNSSP